LEATTSTLAGGGTPASSGTHGGRGNPLKVKAIAEAKVTIDKAGAEAPAQLLKCD
jgi:hypothetical protein